jgi:hypothetical protein
MNTLPTIRFDLDVNSSFSYSEYHTDAIIHSSSDELPETVFSLIRGLKYVNDSDVSYPELELALDFSNPIFSSAIIPLEGVAAKSNGILHFEMPFKVDGEKLYKQNGIDVSTINYSVIDKGSGNVIFSGKKSFKVLPLNQLAGSIEKTSLLLSKFVIDDFPALNKVSLDAIKEHKDLPLLAYQNEDPNSTIEEAGCLYSALHQVGIAYMNPPSKIDAFQKVRLPNQVLSEKEGTCLDLAILLCSALENVGLHSLLILLDGHAICGFFLKKDDSFDYVEKSPSAIYNKASGDDKSIVLIEATCLTSDSDSSFQRAMHLGEEKLRGYRGGFYAVDINRCHLSYLKPLPIANEEGDIDFSIKPVELKKEEITHIEEASYQDVTKEVSLDRFATWEKKLLDLSMGNKLVNFHFNKDSSNAAIILSDSGKSLYEHMKNDEKGSFELRLFSSPLDGTNSDPFSDGLLDNAKEMLEKGIVYCRSDEKSLKRLIKASDSALEETGASTIYLCFGLLTWDAHSQAPFLLLPIRLAKLKGNNGYQLGYDFDDLLINMTFFEYYKATTGNDYSAFYGVNSKMSYADIVTTLKKERIGDVSVDENSIFIANFTFAHYVMWNDIRRRRKSLESSPFIQSLLENKSLLEPSKEPDVSIEEMDKAGDFAAPLPYDSTQLRAILAAGRGESFILDGPPGTGKSQTIVNMIVNAFYQGKSVLFVAEKMAALSVVKERLDKLKLGRFALELYSSKANKQSVYSQLSASMETGSLLAPDEFKKEAERINLEKSELSKELSNLHERGDNVLSLYEAIKESTLHKSYEGKYVLPEGFLDSYDEKKDEAVNKAIDELIDSSSSLSDFNHNPFKRFSFSSFSYLDKDGFYDAIGEFSSLLPKLRKSKNAFGKAIKYDDVFVRESLSKYDSLFSYLLEKKMHLDKLSDLSFLEDKDVLLSSFDELIRMNEIVTSLNHYERKAFEAIDGASYLNDINSADGFFKRHKALKKGKKALKGALKNDEKLKKEEIIPSLTLIKEYQELKGKLTPSLAKLNDFSSIDLLENPIKAQEEKEVYQNHVAFFAIFDSLTLSKSYASTLGGYINLAKKKDPSFFLLYQDFHKALSAFLSTESLFSSRYSLEYQKIGKKDFFGEYSAFFSFVGEKKNFDELIAISSFNFKSKPLVEMGLSSLVEGVKNDEYRVEDLHDLYSSALSKRYIEKYFQDDYVNYFSSESYNSLISHYQDLISEYNDLLIEEVANRLSSRFVSNTTKFAPSTPIGMLKKLISKGGRGMSLRNAMDKYEEYFRMYFPLFLMSPLSSAQYLDVDSKKFDVVIFDEASQIPTSEAIGPIARGNALVVSGDPEQMPPSNYFQTNLDEEDNDIELEDAESLLDDCLSIEMPRRRLSYHYRSHHESLIAFSNANFYHDDLFTFPSKDSLSSHVEYTYVDLKKEKASNALSKEEIEALLTSFKKELDKDENAGKSYGFIVFNLKQQNKLQDEIDSFLEKNPRYKEKAYMNEDKPFVKNLENVQGDERDIIFLSIGFRKGKDGKAVLQGPIMLEKGERRLNVATSRSKSKMVVVSTIHYSDIDVSNKKNQGAYYLRQFLLYAEKGELPDLAKEKDNKKNIASYIRRDLFKLGYYSDIDVGKSDFKLDLAVKDPISKEYSLGVILDEKPLNENVSLNDRYYIETSVLSSLEWKLIHVYSLDYFRYPEKTVERIVSALNEERDPKKGRISTPNPKMVRENKEFDYCLSTYVPYQLPNKLWDSTNLIKAVKYPELVTMIGAIILQEQPLSYETLKERMRLVFGVKRIGPKLDSIIRLNLSFCSYSLSDDYQGVSFYWDANNMTHLIKSFRVSERDVYDISKEEILFMINKCLEAQGSISKGDLIRIVSNKMGLMVVNDKVKGKIAYSLKYGIDSHSLRRGLKEDS